MKNEAIFKGYRLVLAGGLKEEDRPYFEKLVLKAKASPRITLKPNVSYDELLGLYLSARYYWHFAGYGVDDRKHPELVEHLGITPIEAMAMRVVPFCYNAGGPKELIADGVNGYLFQSLSELKEKIIASMNNDAATNTIAVQAHDFAQKNFSYDVYKNNIKQLIK